MFRSSDVNERLPRFREVQGSMQAAARNGGFEGVSPEVVDYLEAAIPVGLNNRGSVVLPRSYNSTTEMPVLMLQDHETGRSIQLRGRAQDVQLAKGLTEESGNQARIRRALLDARFICDQPAFVGPSEIVVEPSDGVPYTAYVPRIMVLGNERILSPENVVPGLSHEADHWSFFLNKAGKLQRNPQYRASAWFRAAVEKEGYRTSYTIESNLGRFAGLRTIEDITRQYEGVSIADVHTLCQDLDREEKGAGRDLPALSRKVMAVEGLFGSAEEPVTYKERLLFEDMGVTDS